MVHKLRRQMVASDEVFALVINSSPKNADQSHDSCACHFAGSV